MMFRLADRSIMLPFANSSLSNAVWWAFMFVFDDNDNGIFDEFGPAMDAAACRLPADVCWTRFGEPASLALAFEFSSEPPLHRLDSCCDWLPNRFDGDCALCLLFSVAPDDGGGEVEFRELRFEMWLTAVVAVVNEVHGFEIVSEIVRLRGFRLTDGCCIFWLQCRLPQ